MRSNPIQSLAAAFAVAWVVTAIVAAVPVPFIALAFRQLDVARDSPT